MARKVYRSPTRVSTFERRTLHRVIACQAGGASSRKIVRGHLARYRRTHARRFFWHFRWADVQPWLKAKLASIAACESGGSPTAVSANGTYRGKYQFDGQTWASVGGRGDPAAASEREQDVRAAALYGQRGSQPWPVCG